MGLSYQSLSGSRTMVVAPALYPSNRFSVLRHLFMCPVGFHVLPKPRVPYGPITAECPCCGKMHYYYAAGFYAWGVYLSLDIPNFPRVLGTIASLGALEASQGD